MSESGDFRAAWLAGKKKVTIISKKEGEETESKTFKSGSGSSRAQELNYTPAPQEDLQKDTTTSLTDAPPRNFTPLPEADREKEAPVSVETLAEKPAGTQSAELYLRGGEQYQKDKYGTKRIKTDPVAETIRQGGAVETERDKFGRPQITKITPAPGAKTIYGAVYPESRPGDLESREPEIKGYELEAKPYYKPAQNTVMPAAQPKGFIEKLRYAGEKETTRAAQGGLSTSERVATEGRGVLMTQTADYAAGFEKTIKNPTPYKVAAVIGAGLVLIGTRNPPLAAKVSAGIAGGSKILLTGYTLGKLKQIGEGTETVGGALGEASAYTVIGVGTSKIVKSAVDYRTKRTLKVVDSKAVTKTHTTPKQTVSKIKGVTRVKSNTGEYVVKTNINAKKAATFKELGVTKGKGTYEIDQITRTGHFKATPIGKGTIKTTSLGTKAHTKTVIEVAGKSKINLLEESYFKYNKGNVEGISYVYKAKTPSAPDLAKSQFIQLSATRGTELTHQTIISESGKTIGVDTSTYFVRRGVQDSKGLNILESYTYKPTIPGKIPAKTTKLDFKIVSARAGTSDAFKNKGIVSVTSGDQKYLKILDLKTLQATKGVYVQDVATQVVLQNTQTDIKAVVTPLPSETVTKTEATTAPQKVIVSTKSTTKKPLLKNYQEIIKEPAFTEAAQTPKIKVLPAIKVDQESKQRSKSSQLSDITPVVTQKKEQALTTRQLVETVQTTKPLLKETVILEQPTFTEFTIMPPPIIPPYVNLPGLPGGSGGGFARPSYFRKKPPKTVYNPTIRAVVSGTTAKTINRAAVATGLGDRPVIKKRKRFKLPF